MILSEYKKHRDAKLNTSLLWDTDSQHFDLMKGKQIVVERVIERGGFEDWWAILNMYGTDAVKEEIKKVPFMTKRNINFVHKSFDIPLEEMKSYRNLLAGKKHWTEI